jgi:hypothetical protein
MDNRSFVSCGAYVQKSSTRPRLLGLQPFDVFYLVLFLPLIIHILLLLFQFCARSGDPRYSQAQSSLEDAFSSASQPCSNNGDRQPRDQLLGRAPGPFYL